jgi:hypothetical protein
MTTTSVLVGLGNNASYSIPKSLRFRSSASAYLNRTFSTPTSSTIYTWSGWVKRGALGATNYLFGASTTTNFGFNSSNNIVLTLAGTAAVTTTAVYRDTSAWYHVVYQQNGAAQTIYINGVSVGTGTTANTVFNTAIAHQIGAANTTNYFDGYITEVNFIDGQALAASSFGTYDANGVWQPINYSGTYGTNGFHLTFGNTASIGADTSGNSNNWTPNNLNTTQYNAFTTTGANSWTAPTGVTSINYLVVAGGGGAGYSRGGGGGAGGLLTGTATVVPGTVYTMTVGAGGIGGTAGGVATNGSNSSIAGSGFTTITAIGGGKGADANSSNVGAGGSGGGGATVSGASQAGGAGTAGQGNNGGASSATTNGAGGGGGASAVGSNGSGDAGGNGGAGTSSSITGSAITYAGGGGGGSNNNAAAGTGGAGGGGNGGAASDTAGSAGTANTGGGGGGGRNNTIPTAGGAGGSGVIIISYVGAPSTSTTYDSMTDSPTASSSTVSNYAVLNPLWQGRTNSPTNGNLDYPASSIGIGTIGVSSGSYYWEITSTGGTTTAALYSTAVSTSTTITTGVTKGFKFNASTGSFDFTVDGTNYTNIATGLTSGPYFSYVSTAAATTASFNAGQRPFTYTPPTGFNALNTYNLPTVTIPNGALYMTPTIYTGTGAVANISNSVSNTIGATFKPDLVWIKSRSATTNNNLFDVIRGTTAYINSNTLNANATDANTLTSFGATGFSLGSDASAIGVNVSAATYVAWQWKANGSGVSNTSGSITSSVSANTTSGFSVVQYTSTGANATVGHGLGVAPSMIFIKNYASATTNWPVYHSSLAATQYLFLNSTPAAVTDATMFNSTAPTSTVFSVGTNANLASGTTIAYCWSAISGYSSFGSYAGNSSADGPFSYCGFRPSFVMVKPTTAGGSWLIWDSQRSLYNEAKPVLQPNGTAAESSTIIIDILSNGFKLRSGIGGNTTGQTYLYAAFAENPFNSSRAR